MAREGHDIPELQGAGSTRTAPDVQFVGKTGSIGAALRFMMESAQQVLQKQ
jgi:hypothetical protein